MPSLQLDSQASRPFTVVTLDVRASGEASRITLVSLLRVVLWLLIIANLGRIPLFSTGEREVPLLANDLALAALIGITGLACVARRSLILDRVGVVAAAFALLGGAVALWSAQRYGLSAFDLAVSLAYLARWVFYLAAYVVVINVVRLDDVDSVWRALEGGIVAFAAFGVIQSAFLPNFAQLVYPSSRLYLDWDPQGHRLISTFLDPNFAGALIMIGLLVLLAQLSTGAVVARWKLLVLFVALVLTASRSSLLAFAVGGMIILSIRGVSKRLLRATAVGVALVLVSLPALLRFAASFNKLTIDASALMRLVSWAHAYEVFRDHPLFGIGFNTWGFVQERYGWIRGQTASYAIDGGLLFIAVLTGIVGVALYLAMLWSVYRNARRVWRRQGLAPAHRGLAIGAVASMIAMLIHGIFTNSLFFPYLMEAQWVIWGLTFVVARSVDASRG